MDFSIVEKNLQDRGFEVAIFGTAAEAVAYLDRKIDGETVGFGGSVTLEQMKLFETLQSHNTVFWHQRIPARKDERGSQARCKRRGGICVLGKRIGGNRRNNQH